MEFIELGLIAVGILGAIIYTIGYVISNISKDNEENFKQVSFIGFLLAFGGLFSSIAVSTGAFIFNFFR